jgi:hypothetical protein
MKWRIGCITPRGYNGDAAAYDAGKRARDAWTLHDQRTVILYLGDHDPSGLDMAVDNARRLHMYATPNYMPIKHWRKVLKDEAAERQRLRARADKLANNWREVETLLGDL